MGDIPNGMHTTAEIIVDSKRVGALETVFDQDWYALDLLADQEVTITLSGTGTNALADPILDLYDPHGTLIAWNYDLAEGIPDAEITFTAATTGRYFVDVYAEGAITGDYELSVSRRASYAPTDSIDWGTAVAVSNIDIYFAERGVRVDGIKSEGWNDYEIQQFMAAMATIEAVTNLTFNRVYSKGEADFAVALDNNGQVNPRTLGWFNPPGETNEGQGVFNGRAWDRNPGGDLEAGGYAFSTIIHEVLHGLGLAHPHDQGGSSPKMHGVDKAFNDFGDFNLNQGVYTTMSYNVGLNAGSFGGRPSGSGNWGVEGTPMALDIAVLQAKYGANLTTASGNDVYFIPTTNTSGTKWQSIWDTGGTDEIRYDGWRDVDINLRAATLNYETGGGGYLSVARKIAGGFTIANGVVIENATSSSGNDWIVGNDVANTIISNGGSDVLRGLEGDDFLFAGTGKDRIFGGGGVDTIDGGGGGDRIFGGADNDVITLGSGADRFVFRRGHGNDEITDFNVASDHLLLEGRLVRGSHKKADLLADAIVDGSGVTLHFDSGDSILLAGLDDTHGLRASIQFI